jgi:large subunit ribosomal protein L21
MLRLARSVVGQHARALGASPSGCMRTAAAASSGRAFSALSPHSVFEHKHGDGSNAPNDIFAVVRASGTQFKVTVGDVMWIEKLDVDVGREIVLDDVLLLGTKQHTVVGRPALAGAGVRAFVEEQTADEKTIVFKYKKRKNYARKHGHRRKLTSLRVVAIEGAGAYLPTASYSAEMAAAMSAASIADFAPKGVHGATAEQDQEWEDAQASAGGDEEEGGEGEDDEGLEEGEAAPPPPQSA